MKKLLTFTLILLLAGSTSFFSSCGTKGDPGADGPQGGPGNANVDAFTFTVASWTNGNSAVVPDNAITQDVVDNGFVQVYAAIDVNNSIWAPLPYYDGFGTYSFNYEAGDVEIDYASGSASASTRQDFKVIAVAGSVRKMMQQQNVNLKSYQAVNNFLMQNHIQH